MKRLALLALPLVLLAPRAASASPAPAIPPRDFPAGANINFISGLDNAGFDVAWGTTGPGDPGFHSVPADTLGRTGGWEEEAILKKSNHTQDFAIFVSAFDSADHALAAAQDMAQTVTDYGLVSTSAAVSALNGSTTDNTTVLRQTDLRWTIYAFTLVQGTTEVEAIVKFRTHHGDGPKDKVDLARAVNDALATALNGGS